MQNAKQTPLYENHIKLGGKMVEFAGWALPVQYTTILAEHKAVRESCGVFDVSHMGEILIKGKGAIQYLNHLLTNDFSAMDIGRCRYSPMCYPEGGVVDDLIIYKKGEERYLAIVNAANKEKDFAWMMAQKTGDVHLEDQSDSYAQLALQGPRYLEVLQGAGFEGELPARPYAFIENAKVAGKRCMLSTTGYTGEPGVELYTKPEDACAIHDALIAAGAIPCGLGSRDTLRFEASMPLYGHELSREITPLECGLLSFVKLDKADFIGKEALAAEPPRRKRIGLELIDKGIAREDCPVLDAEGNVIGKTTSGGPAPTLGKNLAMALVDSASDARELWIEVRGRRLAAKRVKLPFYKAKR